LGNLENGYSWKELFLPSLKPRVGHVVFAASKPKWAVRPLTNNDLAEAAKDIKLLEGKVKEHESCDPAIFKAVELASRKYVDLKR
jgi:hypothetical protein